METEPFLDAIEADLESATSGDDQASMAADRIATVLRSSLQLRLFDALGQAALELSDQIGTGHVEVRLSGRDVELVFVPDEPVPEAPSEADEGDTSRLTLRMPASLKSKVEAAAAREGRSTNAWLVTAVTKALDHRGRRAVGSRMTGFGQS